MIINLADKTTEDIFNGIQSKAARRVPQELHPVICRKLDMLNAAVQIQDLARPPGNRLQALKGDFKGYYSIRVNSQYRIIFKMERANVFQVQVVDYH